MPDLWIGLSTCLLGALLVLVLGGVMSRERRAVSLPAPGGLPLLGHTLVLRAWAPGAGWRRSGALRGDQLLLRALLRWSELYGGAFQLHNGWLGRLLLGGPRVVVVLSDPPAVHALLALGEEAAVKSRRYYGSLDQVLHPGAHPSSLTASTSGQWLLLRRSMLHAFSDSELQQDFEVAKVKALSLASVIVGRGPGAVLDVDDAARRLSLDVAGLSKLGYDFQAVESGGEVLMLRLLEEVAVEWDVRRRRLLGTLAPWLSDGAAEGQSRCRILHHFIEKELWADILARGPPPADDVTVAAQLVRLGSSPSQGGPVLSPERILAELALQLLLAHGPTGHAIAWVLGCLAANRGVQDKLVAELKREGIFDDPLRLTYDILPKLSYLDCVVRETLRLYPTMSCPATVRTLKKDVVLCGRSLPAGAEVWVDVFSMHRSPRLWRDPHCFNPERWAAVAATAATAGQEPLPQQQYDGVCTVETGADADANGAADAGGPAELTPAAAAAAGGSTAESAPPLCNPQAYMPFGSGSRSCLGQRLAMLEIKAAVAVLLCFLVFEPSGMDPGRPGSGDDGRAGPGRDDAALTPLGLGLFLRPVGGMQLLVAPVKRRT